jgi:pyridoxamine 5'-phosphate oxidase
MEQFPKEYLLSQLDIETLLDSPLDQLRLWLEEAWAAGITEPNAVNLATASLDGVPSTRMVLLQGLATA